MKNCLNVNGIKHFENMIEYKKVNVIAYTLLITFFLFYKIYFAAIGFITFTSYVIIRILFLYFCKLTTCMGNTWLHFLFQLCNLASSAGPDLYDSSHMNFVILYC